MSVAIIGAGMTGLLAAKACMDKGIVPTIQLDGRMGYAPGYANHRGRSAA